MPNNAKRRDIEVATRLNPAGPPKLLFTIDDSKLTFKNDHHPGFDVVFTLNDTDHNGYVFPADPCDAMWCQPVDAGGPSACPTSRVHWNGFHATMVSADNLSLHVTNPNGPLGNKSEQQFSFVLRVTKTPAVDDPPCEPLDPIGTNKNGSTGLNMNSTALIVTLLVVGAAAFIAYKLFLS